MPVRPIAPLLLGFCCLSAAAQGGGEQPADDESPPAFAVNEAIGRQRAVRAEAEAELERLLAREAADVLEAGEPIARRGDSLNDALAKFGEAAGLPILLDRPSLELEGLDLRDVILGDPPVVPAAVPVTVRRVLGLLLEAVPDVPLAAVNDGGLLRITTADSAAERLVTRTYDVRDLARFRSTRAASAGLLLDAYGPTPMGGGGVMGGGGLGGGGLGGGGLGGGGGRGAGGFGGGGAFSLPPRAGRLSATAGLPAAVGLRQQPAVTAADRAAAEWEARLKFFERRLELLPGDPDDAVYGYQFQPLIDLLQTSTGGVDAGGGWLEIDGEGGSIEELETGPAGTGRAVLVVRQTDAVHRQIVELLGDLRAAPGDELEPEREEENGDPGDAALPGDGGAEGGAGA